MEIDHTTSNLPHILYHLGIMIIVVTSIYGALYLFIIFGVRKMKAKKEESVKIKEVKGNRRDRRQKESLARKKKKTDHLQSELESKQKRK